LLSAQVRPGEADWSRAYDETVRLAVEAEKIGLSSIWTTEHHFVDDGYMPSLLVVSAAIAAVTSSIEIGTGVMLAPLHHPLRLAEDAATVQLLSGGRLTLGLGLGWSQVEFDGFGAQMSHRGRAMEEILDILPKAWSGKPFRHRGPVFDLPEVAVRPTPSHPIPILIGGGAEAAVRRAARLADGIFANAPVETFLQQLEWVRDELDEVGRDPATFRIVHYSVMLPGDSVEQSMATETEHLWQMMWKYSDMEASANRLGPPPPAPPLTDDQRHRLFGRSTIAGTPAEIVTSLLDIRRRAGVPVEFVARSFFSTMSYARQVELMQQLAEEVAPHI
jgi:probable F420-dependent oxidoreductase